MSAFIVATVYKLLNHLRHGGRLSNNLIGQFDKYMDAFQKEIEEKVYCTGENSLSLQNFSSKKSCLQRLKSMIAHKKTSVMMTTPLQDCCFDSMIIMGRQHV